MNNILKISEDYIFNLHQEKLSNKYSYHDYNHSLKVVNAVKEIIRAENINDNDAELLILSAWFHDVGYINGCQDHELNSAKIAEDFLLQQNYSTESIKIIKSLILATRFKVEPQNYLEEVIKDADFNHFADENYISFSELLRIEFLLCNNVSYTDLEWHQKNLEILTQHHRFYTEYAKIYWQPIKEVNIIETVKKIKKLEDENNKDTKEFLKKKKLERVDKPERGIDTMFRVTLNNHTRLSDIADSKANILLSVNAIIISIILTALIPKLDAISNRHLILPTFILLIASVATIIFAIMSTKPKVTSGTFTREDIENKKVNLLFFGNFFKVKEEEYVWAINEMMKDGDYLYNTMIKDLYYLGLVLNKKYRLLRITYTIFMIGLVLSVIAFSLAFIVR